MVQYGEKNKTRKLNIELPLCILLRHLAGHWNLEMERIKARETLTTSLLLYCTCLKGLYSQAMQGQTPVVILFDPHSSSGRQRGNFMVTSSTYCLIIYFYILGGPYKMLLVLSLPQPPLLLNLVWMWILNGSLNPYMNWNFGSFGAAETIIKHNIHILSSLTQVNLLANSCLYIQQAYMQQQSIHL